MKPITLAAVVLLGLACRSQSGTTSATSTTKAAWSYEGATGPSHWGDLSPEYAKAKTGKQQSPIDISRPRTNPQDGSPLQVSYQDASLSILNNGHTVEDEFE